MEKQFTADKRSFTPSRRDERSFYFGVLASFLGHLFGAVAMIVYVESASARDRRPQEVFTVTLEGGDRLGGLNQVPKEEDLKKKQVIPHQVEQSESEKEEKVEPPTPEKKLESPTAVEDPAKAIEEKKLQEKKESEKKKKEADLKKAEEDKKKKAEEEKKKKADESKKKEEDKKAKAEREKKLNEAIQAAANRYKGESYNAGGQGFGAAATGGKGMGGGTLQSLEIIAYRNELERHIKQGWRWLPGANPLEAVVLITVLPTGVVQDARIVSSSNDSRFDDSALRAVYKASPVPAAPESLYSQFREVRITFNSER